MSFSVVPSYIVLEKCAEAEDFVAWWRCWELASLLKHVVKTKKRWIFFGKHTYQTAYEYIKGVDIGGFPMHISIRAHQAKHVGFSVLEHCYDLRALANAADFVSVTDKHAYIIGADYGYKGKAEEL